MKIHLLALMIGMSAFIVGCKPDAVQDVSDESELKLDRVHLMTAPEMTIGQLDRLVRDYLKDNPQGFDISKSKLTVYVFFQGVNNRARFDFESTIPNDDRTLHIWVSQKGNVRQVRIDTPETADAG